MKSRRFPRLALWAVLGCTAALGAHWGFSIQSQQRFADLIAAPSAGAASGRLMTEKETTLLNVERRRFLKVFALPNAKGRLTKLVPFLRSPDPFNRTQTVVVLGKSENPRFVPALRAALKAIPALPKTQKPRSLSDPSAMPAADSITDWGLFQINVQMAIARIQTRDLPPTPRMKAVAAEIGLSLGQLKDLFAVCNTFEGVTLLVRSKGRVVADRCLDMLAEMGLKGQDIKPFLKWEFMPAHRVRLEAVVMSRDAGIEHILDFLCLNPGLNVLAKNLAQQLWEFGPRVNDHLLARIQDMAAHPQKYLNGHGKDGSFICVFAVANGSHDARLRPILLRFKFHKIPGIKSKWVGSHAGEAEWSIAHSSPQFY